MKKYISIGLTIVLLILSGCSKSSNAETSITYQIYCDSPEIAVASKSSENAENSDIIFTSAAQLDLDYSSMNDTDNKNAEATKQFTFGNDSLQLNLKKSYSTTFASSLRSDLRSYGNYDVYQTDNETNNFEIAFRQNSDRLAFLRAFDRVNQSGDLTEQEARVCADATLTELYGEQVVQKYNNVIVQTTPHLTYAFVYSRALGGYETNDIIAIEINYKGEVCYINARQLGIFDPLAAEITEKRITVAETVLRSSISESYEIQGKKLFVDAISGKCYLQLIVARSTDTGYEGNFFYINVN